MKIRAALRSIVPLASCAALSGCMAPAETTDGEHGEQGEHAEHPDHADWAASGANETAAQRWLMNQLLALQSGTTDGGIYANKPGYHNTRAGNSSSDYSVTDAEDRGGPADKAAAIDWTFTDAQNGRFATIALYSNRLLASARNAADPRLDGWREFFGNADNDRLEEGYDFRYERFIERTGDGTHLWHIHLSEDRDKVLSYDNKVAALSVLKGESDQQWRSTQLLAAVSGGRLFHTMRVRNGGWTGFGDAEAATRAAFTPVDTASAMVRGEQHALVAAADGELWHAIRFVDGPWTVFGNVEDFAGEVGTIRRVAATEVQGALHVVVLANHAAYHTVRQPSGAWTPLLSVEPFAGDINDLLDVAAAGFINGQLQVAVSTSTGRLFHPVRATNGSWTGWGDVEAYAGDPGAPRSISASEVDGVFHLVADYGSGVIRHSVRRTDGSWSPLLNINDYNRGDPGPLLDVAAVGFTNGELQVVALSNAGPVWHAVRLANGTWTPWGDVRAYAGNPGGVTRISLAAGWRN
jgi:hypothetical protein